MSVQGPQPHGRGGWSVAAVLALAVGAAVLVFPRLVFLGDQVTCIDSGRTCIPLQAYLGERWRAGELPLWYPFDGLGTPFVGSALSAAFHPFSVVHRFFSPGVGLTLELLGCVVIALGGTFWLVRRLGGDRAGAAAAAAAVALSGSFISSLANLPLACGAVAFPVWLGGLHQASVGPHRRRGLALAAFALAFAVLGGEFQVAYLYGLVALPFLLATGAARPLSCLRTVALASAGGLGLGAAQLLPTLEIMGELRRTGGFGWEEASAWSAHPLRLPELFMGDLLQYVPVRPPGQLNLLELFGYGSKIPWQPTFFLGSLTAAGLVWAVALAPRRRAAVVCAGLGLVFLVLAMGKWAGLYRLFFEVVPLWSNFRYPEKLMSQATVLLGVGAGLGISEALRSTQRAFKLAAPLAAGALALGLLALGGAALLDPAPERALWALYAQRLGEGCLRAGALIALAAAALRLSGWAPAKRLSALVPALLVAIVLVDVSSTNSRTLTLCTSGADLLRAPSLIAETLAAREPGTGPGRFRVTTRVEVQAVESEEAASVGGASYAGATSFDHQSLVPLYSGLHHLEPTTAYLPSVSSRHAELSASPLRWARDFAPLYNGTYLISSARSVERPGGEQVAAYPGLELTLTKVQGALPRVFLARPLFVASRVEARQALEAPGVRSGKWAVVESAPGLKVDQDAPPGEATLLEYLPEKVVVRTQAQGGGVLVLNDAYHSGWKVEVDGAPAVIHRANYLVRGVLLGPGEHHVVFTYPPSPGLLAGLGLSAFTLLALLGLAISSPARSSRP